MLFDLKVLDNIFAEQTSANRLVRGSIISEVIYGFGDASGIGFGASWVKENEVQDKDLVRYRVSIWGEEVVDNSSKVRELANLIETFKKKSRQGELKGKEVFFFYG